MRSGPKPKPQLRAIDSDDELAPLPDPPSFLDDYATEEWHRLAPELHADGRLTPQDVGEFAAYCNAYGRWRKAEEECKTEGLTITTKSGNVIQNPKIGIANAARSDMVRIAADFGLNPSARGGLGSRNGAKKNDIARKYFD
jgi:P27 family predicted phage terminase small subunit